MYQFILIKKLGITILLLPFFLISISKSTSTPLAETRRVYGYDKSSATVKYNQPNKLAVAKTSATTQAEASPLTNAATNTGYFIQPPRLTYLGTNSNHIRVPNTIYFFTINLPENAKAPLQQIDIKQREGFEEIDFNLEKTIVFEGKRRQKKKKIQIKEAKENPKTQTISIIFDPPVLPGKFITIRLKTIRNPSFEGIYNFEVKAFPLGNESQAQTLGVKRLSFFQSR